MNPTAGQQGKARTVPVPLTLIRQDIAALEQMGLVKQLPGDRVTLTDEGRAYLAREESNDHE